MSDTLIKCLLLPYVLSVNTLESWKANQRAPQQRQHQQQTATRTTIETIINSNMHNDINNKQPLPKHITLSVLGSDSATN